MWIFKDSSVNLICLSLDLDTYDLDSYFVDKSSLLNSPASEFYTLSILI